MKKYTHFCLISLIVTLLAAVVFLSVSAECVVNSSDHVSVYAALDAIPENSGDVKILMSPGSFSSEDEILSIPTDRGISSIAFLPQENTSEAVITGIARICANGIPLVIGNGIDMPDASVYGGICASGESAELETSSLTISGSVGFVFGGGFAENGGESCVSETDVTLTETGFIYYEIFGGGHAFGEGSRVFSKKTSIQVLGTVDYALGGGYAEDGGLSEVTQTSVIIGEAAQIQVALFSGGSASGKGSLSSVDSAKAVLSGFAHWSFSGDFAFAGGETRLNRASRLEIHPTGSAVQAYLGSFSSDPGSYASVNTSEVENCGTVERIIPNSQSADGGDAKTLVPANFPCQSGHED